MSKRTISDVLLSEQRALLPFEFKTGPTTSAHTDENNVQWVGCTDFTDFEISETKVIRHKSTKKIKTIYPDRTVNFFVSGRQYKKSVDGRLMFSNLS